MVEPAVRIIRQCKSVRNRSHRATAITKAKSLTKWVLILGNIMQSLP